MSISKERLFLVILFLLNVRLMAQSEYEVGALPSININGDLSKGWGFNLRWESRQLFAQGEFGGESQKGLEYILSDVSAIISRKVGLNNNIAGGYIIRNTGSEVFHRLTQRFVIVSGYTRFRIAHRLSTDQTFSESENTEYRIRYRISTEIPLNGQSVDPKELYFKFNNEYLQSWQGNESDFEIRLVPSFGYQFNDDNKLEFGLDYRLDSFINNSSSSHTFWLSVGWFFKIN